MDISKLCVSCFNEKKQGVRCTNCGYKDGDSAQNELHLPPGSVLKGQYLIGKVLGYGGFGVTYLAYDLNLQTLRAIKEYLPGELSSRSTDGITVYSYSGEAAANYEYGLERFVEEGRVLSKFAGIDAVVSIYDYFRENNTAYIVMEYLDGMDLSEYIKKAGGKIAWEEVERIFSPIIFALSKIHTTGLIHRDIAPDNIYITNDGKVKLIDFGAARQAVGEKSASLSVILKPGYAPPEQYHTRGKQGPWTDIYALGATIYRSLTGITPTESLTRVMNDDLKPLSETGVNVPQESEIALAQSLNLDEGARFRNMDDFHESLFEGKQAPKVKQRAQLIGGGESFLQKAKFNILKPLYIKITAIIVCVALICSLLFAVVMPTINYSTANKLFQAQEYKESGDKFRKLGRYKESVMMLARSLYREGESYYDTGDFDDSIDPFSELAGYYPETEILVTDAKFMDAVKAGTEGDFEKAEKKLEKVPDYKNAQELIKAAKKKNPNPFVDESLEHELPIKEEQVVEVVEAYEENVEMPVIAKTSSNDKKVIFYSEDFNSYNNGILPNGWKIVYNGSGDANQVVTNKAGDQCLKIDGAPSWSGVLRYDFESIPDRIEFTFRAYTKKIGSIKIGNGSYYTGVGLKSYGVDSWHDYRFIIDYVNKVATLYVDDELIADDLELGIQDPNKDWATFGESPGIVIDTGNASENCDVFIDNIIIKSLSETPAEDKPNIQLIKEPDDVIFNTSVYKGSITGLSDDVMVWLYDEENGNITGSCLVDGEDKFTVTGNETDIGIFIRIINNAGEEIGNFNLEREPGGYYDYNDTRLWEDPSIYGVFLGDSDNIMMFERSEGYTGYIDDRPIRFWYEIDGNEVNGIYYYFDEAMYRPLYGEIKNDTINLIGIVKGSLAGFWSINCSQGNNEFKGIWNSTDGSITYEINIGINIFEENQPSTSNADWLFDAACEAVDKKDIHDYLKDYWNNTEIAFVTINDMSGRISFLRAHPDDERDDYVYIEPTNDNVYNIMGSEISQFTSNSTLVYDFYQMSYVSELKYYLTYDAETSIFNNSEWFELYKPVLSVTTDLLTREDCINIFDNFHENKEHSAGELFIGEVEGFKTVILRQEMDMGTELFILEFQEID